MELLIYGKVGYNTWKALLFKFQYGATNIYLEYLYTNYQFSYLNSNMELLIFVRDFNVFGYR